MKTKQFIKSGLILFLLCGILSIGFFNIKGVQASLWTQIAEQALEITSEGGEAFNTYIILAQEQVHNLVGVLSETDTSEESVILDNLNLLGSETSNYIVLDLDHGYLYSNHLESKLLLDEEDLEFYRTFSGKGVKENYLDIYNGHDTLGVYECFTFADGSRGLVEKGRRTSELSELFSLSFFNETGFSYITNQAGDVLIRPTHRNSNRTFTNIFDMIIGENKEEDVETFREKMSDGSSGVMQLSFNGSENIITFSPVRIAEGWYIIAIIPMDAVMDDAEHILQSSRIFAFLIFFIFVIGLLFLLFERQSRKQIEKKEQDVRYREQMFGVVSENMDDVFLMLNEESHVVEYVTPNINRVLGISVEEAKADPSLLYEPAYRDEEHISYPELSQMQPGQLIRTENERTHKKTAEKHWFYDFIYCMGDSQSKRFVIVLSDRTKENQKKLIMESALNSANAANKSKSDFFNNISHDIRTPMNAIMGFATLLNYEAGDPQRVKEYTRKIMTSGQYLLNLINDVLDMSKIESGRVTLNLAEMNLSELIDEVMMLIQPQSEAKHQELKLYRTNLTVEHLNGDKLRIKQVLLNLLSNAVKYTPPGGRIQMTVTQLPQTVTDFVPFQFEIRDNGIGMSEEFLKNVFEPFARENNHIVNEIQGTGLGLPIVKNLVSLMGGTIDVKSKEGEGSVFTVILELYVQKQPPVTVQEENKKMPETETSGSGLAGLNILAAEDNELNAEILLELLRLNDAACDIVKNGQQLVEAFEKSQPGQYDLILTDIQMPVMNGYDAARAIRACKHPCGKEIPIVAMTANAFEEDVREAMDAGMNAHVSKPIDMKKLESTITELIRKKE